MDLQRITETIHTLQEIVTELYQNHISEGKKHMADVLENLAVFATWMTAEQQTIYVQNILQPIVEAMEGTDSVYLADIINYELIPFIGKNVEE